VGEMPGMPESATPEPEEPGADIEAVLVRRSDLPVPLAHPARSFFGGLPKLPPEIDWPRAEVAAADEPETVALTFIAQIDLSELPDFEERSLFPQTGTLYFFCSSVFEDEGRPPCRILYYAGAADRLPERAPPPDLMPLAGQGGGYQVQWLDPAVDFHSRVEFKYPVFFLPFRDFVSQDDPVDGQRLVESLCEALGPGVPKQNDLLMHRTAEGFAMDEDWPFNRGLITLVSRSVLCLVRDDLEPSPWRRTPLSDETRAALRDIEADANGWMARSALMPALDKVDGETKSAFRTWWADVVLKYAGMQGQVSAYPSTFARDLGDVINHAVRHAAAHGEAALAAVPRKYIANLEQQNHWKTPDAMEGRRRFFSTPIHQISGYGSSWQDAPIEHDEDVLLLQIQGDLAFFNWHANTGCVLHFWIDPGALSKLDFSAVEATLECD
jgi:Domain of unknown function (DUF1963)